MKTMQKNKIVLAVTAVVVLALLFAGVGYATFTGNARTYNQDNTQTLAYMSVTPGDFDPIFTDTTSGKSIFDTYVYYEDPSAQTPVIKKAYAFNGVAEDVKDIKIDEITYKAAVLGSKVMTVLNNTGEDITKLNFSITASPGIGTTDFVYIFGISNAGAYLVKDTWAENTTYYKLVDKVYADANISTEDEFNAAKDALQDGEHLYIKDTTVSYIVFDDVNVPTKAVDVAASLFDTKENAVTITVYLGYVPNVYVPGNYIGPAADNEGGYFATTVWDPNEEYYTKSNGEYSPASPAPTEQQVEAGGYYYKAYDSTLPYRQTANGPIDLAKTSFGIEVTDASA